MSIWSRLKAAWRAIRGTSEDGRKGKIRPGGYDPRPYLSGEAPGYWASDHYLESLAACKGWQFVAIRTVARMCSQGELSVHEVGTPREKYRRARRALRMACLLGDRHEERWWRGACRRLRRECRRAERLAEKAAEPTVSGAKPQRHPVSPEHPLLRLLQKPNVGQSLSTMLFQLAQQISATGTGYVWCVRNEAGVPVELYVPPTALMAPRPPRQQFPAGSYYLSPASTLGMAAEWAPGLLGGAMSTGYEIDARDVKAIRWPHLLHLSDGLSPLAACALWADVSNQLDVSNWSLLQNGERPGMVWKWVLGFPEPDEADVSRFREDLRQDFSGTANTGKHLLPPPGLEAAPRANTPAEMDFAGGRKDYRDANLASHGVTPISAGVSEGGNYSANYAAEQLTTEKTIQPLLSLIADELGEFLGGEWDGPRCEAMLTARSVNDPTLLEQRLKTDIQAGNVLTVNEYRAQRGLPPLPPGKGGEKFAGERPAPVAGAGAGAGADGKDGGDDGVDDGKDGKQTDTDTGTSNPAKKKVPGRVDGDGSKGGTKGARLVRETVRETIREFDPTEPRDEEGKWTTGGKATRGPMADARRVGEGKDARVVLADGSPAPAHITPAMVGQDWTEVKVAIDGTKDVLVTARDSKGRAKTVYSDRFHGQQAAIKFARTREGLVEAANMRMENQANRGGANKNEADCCWLMMVQGTRPGSESDNKGNSHLFGYRIDKKDVKIEHEGKKTTVKLTIDGEDVEIKDKKAKAELRRRVEQGLPLHDSTYWLKSHGATTLEGRHVVEKDGGVYVEFMGKESVWHSHRIRDEALGAMLMARKRAAGDRGLLFATNAAKVGKYARTLDGGKFTPKDFRTQLATGMAAEAIAGMPMPANEKARKAAIKDVGARVSHVLGNEPSQALSTYIAPEVFSVWEGAIGVSDRPKKPKKEK